MIKVACRPDFTVSMLLTQACAAQLIQLEKMKTADLPSGVIKCGTFENPLGMEVYRLENHLFLWSMFHCSMFDFLRVPHLWPKCLEASFLLANHQPSVLAKWLHPAMAPLHLVPQSLKLYQRLGHLVVHSDEFARIPPGLKSHQALVALVRVRCAVFRGSIRGYWTDGTDGTDGTYGTCGKWKSHGHS